MRGQTSAPDRRLLDRSAELLAHRGPDSSGVHAGPGIGLAHTRLSLLDLDARSDQPFWDRERRYCLVYNGEIYNFEALRAELETRGVVFRTTSDTEVLLESLLAFGVDAALPRFQGMFAFALYDAVEHSLTLSRDRFGIKPLFVRQDGDRTVFASEVAALRPWSDPSPDLLAISAYLQGSPDPGLRHTFYQGVKRVPPGGVVRIGAEDPAASSFFSFDDLADEELAAELGRLDDETLVDRVEDALRTSVEQHLLADAPVGALCSGGVDSSTVLAMAARTHPDLAIFHANVVGRESEYDAAAALARHLGLEMHTADVHDDDFIDALPDVVAHYGRPFIDTPHSVPFLRVCQLVRSNGVKAVLSGEGADECFFGYRWQRSSAPTWRRLATPVSTRFRFGRGRLMEAREAQQLHLDLHNRFEPTGRVATSTSMSRAQATEVMRNSLGMNLRVLLHRNDTMGMATSIESRFPFLDNDLVRLAANLPYAGKIRGKGRGVVDKWVLRQVAARYLPRELYAREKRGFPVSAYRRMDIGPEFLVGSAAADLLELSADEGRQLMARAPEGVKLRLLHLDAWAAVCLHDVDRDEVLIRLRKHVTIRPAAAASPRTPAA